MGSSRKSRAAIPAPLRRRILMESGFACAFPSCEFSDVDVHHIRDYSIVLEHTYDNLISLCPNHHRRATQGKISQRDLQALKLKLKTQHGTDYQSLPFGRVVTGLRRRSTKISHRVCS